MRLFAGDDWAEDHHDIEVMDEAGTVLVKRRLPEGAAGMTQMHALIGRFVPEDEQDAEVAIGIETDRGPWVAALVAAGYVVFPVNPLQASRYRQRHGVLGAKSDGGDAHMLPDMVRTDSHQLRPAASDSPEGQGIKVVARAHLVVVMKHSWSIASSTGGFLVTGGGAPRFDQTVTNPSQAGWKWLIVLIVRDDGFVETLSLAAGTALKQAA